MVTGIWLVSYLSLWLVVLFQGFLIFGLFRELGVRLANRGVELDKRGLPVGSRAPSLIHAESVGEPDPNGQAKLLVFGSRQCAPCRDLAGPLADFADRHRGQIDVYFITDESPSEAAVTRDELGLTIPVVGDRSAQHSFDVPVTPFAFVVDGDGFIRSKGIVNQLGGLEWLWSQANRMQTNGSERRRPVWR